MIEIILIMWAFLFAVNVVVATLCYGVLKSNGMVVEQMETVLKIHKRFVDEEKMKAELKVILTRLSKPEEKKEETVKETGALTPDNPFYKVTKLNKRPRRKFTKEEVSDVLDKRHNTKTLAEKYGITVRQVHNMRHYYGKK